MPRIAYLGFRPDQCISWIGFFPILPVLYMYRTGLLKSFPAPPRIIWARCFWFLQPPALPPAPGAAFIFANIFYKPFHAPMVNIQVLAPCIPLIPQAFQGFPCQPLCPLDDRMVVMPPAYFPRFIYCAVFCRHHPFWPRHPMFIAPPVQALYVICPVPICCRFIPWRRQVAIIICSRPHQVPFPEIGVDKLHMIPFCPMLIVCLHGHPACFLSLCPCPRLMLPCADWV